MRRLARSPAAVATAVLLASACVLAQSPTGTRPSDVAAARRLSALDPLIAEAISEHRLPGAVVSVGRPDRVVYQKAFGRRAIVPAQEAMTTDTIFDVASLTKVVATTTR